MSKAQEMIQRTERNSNLMCLYVQLHSVKITEFNSLERDKKTQMQLVFLATLPAHFSEVDWSFSQKITLAPTRVGQ